MNSIFPPTLDRLLERVLDLGARWAHPARQLTSRSGGSSLVVARRPDVRNRMRDIPFNRPFTTGRELDFIREAIAATRHLSGNGPFTGSLLRVARSSNRR